MVPWTSEGDDYIFPAAKLRPGFLMVADSRCSHQQCNDDRFIGHAQLGE